MEGNGNGVTMDREQFVIHVIMKFRASCIDYQPIGV
jgi:hypothetical protein